MKWKVTIKQHWEEIEPKPPDALDIAWWGFLIFVGVVAGRCVGGW